jgi:predicted O-methyltransferase YrrM
MSIPTVLEEAFSSGRVVAGDGAPRPLAGNVTRDEALALYRVVRALRPVTSVEVGLAQGISTTAILKALADNGAGTHHVLDPHQRHYDDCGLTMASRAGVAERMVFHARYAEDVIPQLGPVQFAFIDSSHLFDLTISEFVLVDKKLDVGGVIGFHDLWMPSLRKVVRYVLANRAYRVFPSPQSAAAPPRWRASLKPALARALRALPAAGRRMLRPEVLQPWSALGLGSLVFLEKLAADDRHWTFHREF